MTASDPKKLFLLDAFALIYRSYYAFIRNPRYNSKGVNTSAMLGFTNTLVQLLEKENPNYIGVVFDVSAPTFRHMKCFRNTKPTARKCPKIYVNQFRISGILLRRFNIPIIEMAGFEADDVIGTLARKAEKEGLQRI
jgi:DNA polymerase I